MYTIGIDTSHRFLLVALIRDDTLLDSVQLECFKHQSEYLIPEVQKLLAEHQLTVNDIENWVVTRGPGSYTGVRIGMTMVKVVGSLMKKNVYTLSTLQLYAGLDDTYVIMDARARRVYAGRYKDGKAVMADTVYTNDYMAELIQEGVAVKGDLHLFGKDDIYGSLAENFVLLKPYWEKVENVDLLAPSYLKDSEEYLK